MRDVIYRNIPPLRVVPSADATNGRDSDALSGWPIPPQYLTYIRGEPRDSRFPDRIDEFVPNLFAAFKIFDGDVFGDVPEDE